MTEARGYGAVAELKHIGVYFIGGGTKTIDFLATGSLSWKEGPTLPQRMSAFCAVTITPTSFLTIYKSDIYEFDAAIAGPTSEEGWREVARWPQLKTPRWAYHGCAKVGNKVIISGGYNGIRLRSTEVLDLSTRTISAGGDMETPRIHFNLATIRSGGQDKVFALAGIGVLTGSNCVNTVEEWVEESSTWKAAESLKRKIRYFGTVALQKELICKT